MVQIKIKGLGSAYHVFASYDNFDAFMSSLKERLEACQGSYDRPFEAFFHIPHMKSSDLLKMMQVCAKCHTIMLGINYTLATQKFIFLEEHLRGGESYVFQEGVVLLGNIRKQAYVTCYGSLYVMGSMCGSVDFLYEDSILCCSSLHGNVRICDSSFQNMTSPASVKVYYKNRFLEMKEYKEERLWERQLP